MQACGAGSAVERKLMPKARNRTLNGRANQAGILFAAANAPLTFERTLMPRGTMDQALVTALSAAANHALIGLVQESVQAAALVVSGQSRRVSRDDHRWSRASIATDAAAIGLGIGVQRAFAQEHRESLARGVRARWGSGFPWRGRPAGSWVCSTSWSTTGVGGALGPSR